MKSIPKIKIVLKMMMIKNNDDPKVQMTIKIKTVKIKTTPNILERRKDSHFSRKEFPKF